MKDWLFDKVSCYMPKWTSICDHKYGLFCANFHTIQNYQQQIAKNWHGSSNLYSTGCESRN